MFRRFWSTKWVYGNRRHWCSFKATINWLICNDVEWVGLQKCYLGFYFLWKKWKFSKRSIFLFLIQFPPNQNFQKTVINVRGLCLMNMCTQFQVDIFKNGWKHVKNRHFSRHFGTLPWFSEFCFLTDFDASKSVLGSFFAFFTKIWPKNMYHSSKSLIFLFDLFHPVTWDDLDLYYGHKAQEMILTDVSDTIHADSLTLFALIIYIFLAVVTKSEK